MTRRYEVVYIFDSTLEEPAVTERLAKFHALLGPGVQVNVTQWGKRALAYPIKHNPNGYYAVAQFAAAPQVLPEFERAIKLDESVLRHLTVLLEGEMPAPMPVEAPVGAEEDEE